MLQLRCVALCRPAAWFSVALPLKCLHSLQSAFCTEGLMSYNSGFPTPGSHPQALDLGPSRIHMHIERCPALAWSSYSRPWAGMMRWGRLHAWLDPHSFLAPACESPMLLWSHWSGCVSTSRQANA